MSNQWQASTQAAIKQQAQTRHVLEDALLRLAFPTSLIRIVQVYTIAPVVEFSLRFQRTSKDVWWWRYPASPFFQNAIRALDCLAQVEVTSNGLGLTLRAQSPFCSFELHQPAVACSAIDGHAVLCDTWHPLPNACSPVAIELDASQLKQVFKAADVWRKSTKASLSMTLTLTDSQVACHLSCDDELTSQVNLLRREPRQLCDPCTPLGRNVSSVALSLVANLFSGVSVRLGHPDMVGLQFYKDEWLLYPIKVLNLGLGYCVTGPAVALPCTSWSASPKQLAACTAPYMIPVPNLFRRKVSRVFDKRQHVSVQILQDDTIVMQQSWNDGGYVRLWHRAALQTIFDSSDEN